MDKCSLKKYLDRWHKKYPKDKRVCPLYYDLNENEKEYCEKVGCKYTPSSSKDIFEDGGENERRNQEGD